MYTYISFGSADSFASFALAINELSSAETLQISKDCANSSRAEHTYTRRCQMNVNNANVNVNVNGHSRLLYFPHFFNLISRFHESQARPQNS